MDMNAANRPTAAESALNEAYSQQVGSLPGNGAVFTARDKLFDQLKRGGLPTRRVEAWHYTDLKSLLRQVPASDTTASANSVDTIVSGATKIALVQGYAATPDSLPGGLTVTKLTDALSAGDHAADLVAIGHDDAIGQINGSFVSDGYVLSLEADAELEQPVELQCIHAGGQVHSRFPVDFGAGSKATVIERHLAADGDAPAFVSAVSDVTVGDGAEITWIIVQGQGAQDTHLSQFKAKLGTDSKLRLFIVNAGGKLVREEVHVVTKGEGSDFILRGVNLLGGETHTDVTMTLAHDLPNTTSTEVIRNVVFDRAKGVFQGQIRVAPDAQKTDARMACNTLLMSDDGEYSVKPELEIFADDVQCAHGATVADIDHTHLYYLMARGIPEKKARGLLINAFVAEVIEELDDEPLVEALEAVISNWLEHHG
ncbi:Fe-S cluster assembly protein SufD [Rhizobium halophytocola]|uniref:Fe-S cluster assembly protein SufD n=1 Tax=Rhizobium halophytocola TaxID=735519 RepID=A0ABS4DZF7_9HYPH|nr:Fe-S cluster assembly protein SufD [Rhizobium halophytocola]MBP1851072.1 Fe-S cluster assembly protein SufD [Rhizobium halophytocola]